MIIKQFNNLEEMQEYYNKETNTYAFIENGVYIDLVVFDFDLNVKSNIKARHINANDINANNISACNIEANDINANDIYGWNIDAHNINGWNIDAHNINGWNIDAEDIHTNTIYANSIKADNILYFAVCFAFKNIKCKSIKGFRENHKQFVLDGNLEIEENN